VKSTTPSLAQARRIAVRAQLLDGSAGGVLDTIRRLGFLQIDTVAPVAVPQQLVLWSRLGPFDTAELDRLLWDERALVEWNAFIWPVETLPLLQARMRGRRPDTAYERRNADILASNRGFRRYVLRELEPRGPLLSRELEDRSGRAPARPPLVRQPPRRRDAARPPRPRTDRDRRAPRRPAAVGSRGALVPRDRAGLAP
jgi:uncharacterized protein YcaQ